MLCSEDSDDDEENEQDFDAERDAFTGHLKRLLSLENSDSILLVVVFVRNGDAEQNADDERNDDKDRPREERDTVIKWTCLQEGEHEEQEENDERHRNTSFLW